MLLLLLLCWMLLFLLMLLLQNIMVTCNKHRRTMQVRLAGVTSRADTSHTICVLLLTTLDQQQQAHTMYQETFPALPHICSRCGVSGLLMLVGGRGHNQCTAGP